MSSIPGIYENGIVRPLEPIELPEGSLVEIVPEPRKGPVTDIDFSKPRDMTAIYVVLDERYSSGETDVAERHNEHQP